MEKNAAYPLAFATLHQEGPLPASWTLRQGKSVHNVGAPEQRLLTRRMHPGLGFGSCRTVQRPMQGYEALSRLRQGQGEGIAQGDGLAQKRVMARMFALVA